MGLQDALRKAAALIVEIPAAPRVNSSDDIDADIDALLAASDAQSLQLEKSRAGRPDVDELMARQGVGTAKKVDSTSAPQTKTVEQIVRDASGPNLDEIGKQTTPTAPNVTTGEPLKPAEIYVAAKLPPTPFAAEQMLEMLASLPKELPLETRRATVKITLNALGKSVGASPETIVADASRKVAALASYTQFLAKRTDEMVTSREDAAIKELQAQIEAKKTAINRARQGQAQTVKNCDEEAERLDDVLEFFSLDVAPSKYAPDTKTNAPAPNAPTPNVAPKTDS